MFSPHVAEHGYLEEYYSNKAEAIAAAKRYARGKKAPVLSASIDITEVRIDTDKASLIRICNGSGPEQVRHIATIDPKYATRLCYDEDRWVVFSIKTGKTVGFAEYCYGDEEGD